MEENNTQNKANPAILIGVIVAVLVLGAVIVLGMGGRDSETENGAASETSEEVLTQDTEDAMPAENIIEVEGGSFYFDPNEIRVKAGETVTLTLNSVDMMHDFVIDELNIQTPTIQAGDSTTVTFTPETPGEYEFYCSVANHRAEGMVGTLIVE